MSRPSRYATDPSATNWRDHLNHWPYAQTVMDRLIASLKPDGDCWLWTKCTTDDGYGQISVKKAMIRAHQVAYHLFIGPVPVDLQLDHLCRVRRCANPWHLDPVTSAINTRRGDGALSLPNRSEWTHCVNGHAFNERNTYVHPATGYRSCRRCRADRQKTYDDARRAAA